MSASTSHAFPALHNAMWPGLVGKGPDSEPPIDLDTMLNLTAAAEVDGVKFDGVDLFLSLPHTDIDSSDDDLAKLAEKLASQGAEGGVAGGAGVAADRRRVGDGRCGGARAISDAGAQGLPDRAEAARAGNSAVRRGADRFGGGRGRLGEGSGGQYEADRARRSGKPARSPRISANGWRRRARSAGAACIAGGATCSCWRWSAGRRRSDSRRTWRTRCCSRWATTRRRTACCRRISTGRRRRRCTRLTRRWRRAASLDDRFPRGAERRHGEGLGLARQDGRHCPPRDPNGKLDIVRDAGAWLRDDGRQADARRSAHLLGRLHVPERDDDSTRRPGTTCCA